MNREELFKNLEDMTIGLDETFRFHCTQCGKCCTNREDIMLNPMDIFKMSKELGMSPSQFFQTYCMTHVGDASRFPIIRLKPVGSNRRCPLLKNQLCSVHNVKPAVCAMYPLGRYIAIDQNSAEFDETDISQVKYLLQPIDCGDKSEEHTVRRWLGDFNFSLEDHAFLKWNGALNKICTQIKKLEKQWDMMTMMEIWYVVRVIFYENYELDKDFLPQFESNVAGLLELLNDIPRLKGMVKHAGRP